MKKIISLVILVMVIFMSCAMEPPEDVIISGYIEETVLTVGTKVQLTANVPVTWSNNAPNGLVTITEAGSIEVIATDYNNYKDTITVTAENLTISGYTEGTVLYTSTVQLTSNFDVTWSDNAPNGLVTEPVNGYGYVIVTATDTIGNVEEIVVTFGIDAEHDFRLVGEWQSTFSIEFYANGTYEIDNSELYNFWNTANNIVTLENQAYADKTYSFNISEDILTIATSVFNRQ